MHTEEQKYHSTALDSGYSGQSKAMTLMLFGHDPDALVSSKEKLA